MSDQIKIFVPNENVLNALNVALSRFEIEAAIDAHEGADIRIACGEKDVRHDLPCRLGGVIDTVLRLYRHASKQHLKALSFSGWALDVDTLLLSSSGIDPVRLTEKEVAILMLLHEKNEMPVSRDDLLRDVWGYAEGLDTHTLETHIYRLRQKIEQDPAKLEILITDDAGYILKV